MAVICPYCEIEISESALEAEGGCCPDCGSIVTAGRSSFAEDEDFDEDFDENDEDIDNLDELDDLDEMDFGEDDTAGFEEEED